jgi:lysophospholipase L1-like esterase
MIGANDVFVCQRTTKDGCLSPAEQHAVFAKINRNVRRIVSALRNKAHYSGQLVILHYYSLNYASSFITGVSRMLNKAQDAGAKRSGAVVADGFGTFKRASQHSGENPCTAGLLTQLGSPGKCGVHPSYAGQALLAQAVARAVRLR